MKVLAESVKRLIRITTIGQVVDNDSNLLHGTDETFSRFTTDQGQQADIGRLEDCWMRKFTSMGTEWNPVRQNFRFMYDTFEIFYYSFQQLKINKIACIEERDSKSKMILYNQLCGPNLYAMYNSGKRMVDIVQKLSLLDGLNQSDQEFLRKFSETRNKVFEHNFNPRELHMQIEPVLWSMASTDSWLEVRLHLHSEATYTARIDYYQDYYDAEDIFRGIIEGF